MLFSIIIPTFKSWSNLMKCLDYLVNQTFEGDFEIIVIDNDLEFNPPEELKKYKNLKLIHEPKPGSYAARNAGIKIAKGEVLAFTDSDCLPDLGWLRNAKNYFDLDKKREIGILAGKIDLFYKDNDNLSSAEVYEKYTAFKIASYVKDGNAVTANWFSYKDVIEKYNGFNAKLKSNGDSELSSKISKNLKIIYANDVIVKHPARNKIIDLTRCAS